MGYFIFILLVLVSSSFCGCVEVALRVLIQKLILLILIVGLELWPRKCFLQLGNCIRAEGFLFWHNNIELNVQVAESALALVEGHSLPLYALHIVLFYYFPRPRLDIEFARIQVFEFQSESRQRLVQAYVPVHVQVGSLSREDVMFFGDHPEIEVCRCKPGQLVSLSVKLVVVLIRHAPVELDLHDYFLVDDFLAVAGLALIFGVDNFSLRVALVARLG